MARNIVVSFSSLEEEGGFRVRFRFGFRVGFGRRRLLRKGSWRRGTGRCLLLLGDIISFCAGGAFRVVSMGGASGLLRPREAARRRW